MRFNELDARMRVFETAHDLCVLPGVFTVARIDGRGFTRLTKEVHSFEAPFDRRFHDYMVGTTTHLMDCGFQALFGYTQSDEISVLLDPSDNTFGRKLRKLNSVLAGEASAYFTSQLGDVASFDCRICQLPRREDVLDYFRWRQEDAARNALNGHCYWLLRRQGKTASQATAHLSGVSRAAKNELLFSSGINFNDLPSWHKRGTGVVWETYEKEGTNPMTGKVMVASRRRLSPNYELPMKQEFEAFVDALIPSGAQGSEEAR